MLLFDHCKNCKYYIQYYIQKDFHFRRANGMCFCPKRANRLTKPLEICDYWEEKEITPEQTKKNVIQTIDEINKKLYEILEVLNLDKE